MVHLPIVFAVMSIAAVGVFIAYVLRVLDAEERAHSDSLVEEPAPRPEPERIAAGR